MSIVMLDLASNVCCFVLSDPPAWRLYDFIARHFIASLSPDCRYTAQRATLSIAGERFSVSGQVVVTAGWTTVGRCRLN